MIKLILISILLAIFMAYGGVKSMPGGSNGAPTSTTTASEASSQRPDDAQSFQRSAYEGDMDTDF